MTDSAGDFILGLDAMVQQTFRDYWPLPSRFSNLRGHSIIAITILVLFAAVAGLELITSADYVFSYLYVGPILLANFSLSRRLAVKLTILASLLVMFNLWIPGSHTITGATITNRIIAVIALGITAGLSHRNKTYASTLAQQEAKLQVQTQLASLREDFVSTLTHDLKTPLLGAVETLKAFQSEGFGPVSPDQQKVLATMMRSQQMSLQLVETVLDAYRNDVEGVSLVWAPVNLFELVETVLDSLQSLALSYQVSLQFPVCSLSDEQAWVQGDAVQLHRVLTNLMVNGIYHSPIGGQVVVRFDQHQEETALWQIIQVVDDGPGISFEELPQLFERFYQGQSARQAKGSGLGLYLSRQIVVAHGGKIWAEPRSPQGAVFGFSLPRTEPG